MRTPIIPAALVAALALGTLTACVPAPDPLALEIAEFASLDADGLAALSGEAEGLANELVMEAAGLPDETFPIVAPPDLDGGPGFAVGDEMLSIINGEAFSLVTRMVLEKLADARTTDERLEGGTEPGAHPNLSYSYSVENGHLVGSTSIKKSGTSDSGLVGDSSLTTAVDLTACPAADGSVSMKIDFQTKAGVAKSVGSTDAELWGALDFSVTATAHVGDDAQLTSVELSSIAEITEGGALAEDGDAQRGGINFASRWAYTLPYTNGEPTQLDPKGLPTITRSSSAVSPESQTKLLRATAGITYSIATAVLLNAQEHWRSGACVQMGIAADSDIPTVEKDSTTAVTVSPIAKSDRKPTGGTIVAERDSGAGTIDPTDAQPSPGEYRYHAPDADDTTVITFTSTSKRGIGILPQKFQTSIPGWEIRETINGISTYALKCGSLSGEWNVVSSGEGWYIAETVADVDTKAGTGTYSIAGEAEGFAFTGGGKVTLETLPDGTLMMRFLPGETNYFGNGDFVVREAPDICS